MFITKKQYKEAILEAKYQAEEEMHRHQRMDSIQAGNEQHFRDLEIRIRAIEENMRGHAIESVVKRCGEVREQEGHCCG